MTLQNQTSDLLQGAIHRFDLLEGVDTIDGFILEHPQDPLDVTLDGKQPTTSVLPRCGVEMETVTLDVTHAIGSTW
jgi:hypothetical protein